MKRESYRGGISAYADIKRKRYPNEKKQDVSETLNCVPCASYSCALIQILSQLTNMNSIGHSKD